MKNEISITGMGSVSSLGSSPMEIWAQYLKTDHCFHWEEFEHFSAPVAGLSEASKLKISNLRESDAHYRELDDSVLFALEAARSATQMAGWKEGSDFGINIGSSRGATGLFEKYHQEYLRDGRSSTLASPTTTLGNIASWVAHDLRSKGPEISHSITCSTALHALINGVAWLRSGMCDKFLVGGSEASLTPFTIAQMKALKIYADLKDVDFPCRALDMSKKRNTMILGEGAAVVCLENGKSKNSLAVVEGIGYATEVLKHNISISSDAKCFQDSMKMALGNISPTEVDVVVMHAPGTIKGDLSEVRAIEAVFGKNLPAMTSNKWKIGHTFGASGLLSVELALLMLINNRFIGVPFVDSGEREININRVMVNAVGFGGNAVSVLLKKPV